MNHSIIFYRTFFSEDATYFELFGVKAGAAQAGEDTRGRRKQSPKRSSAPPPRGPPPPAARHEYPNWEDAFSHRDFAFASESDEGKGARGSGDTRRSRTRTDSRSPSPIKRAEKMQQQQPASKIDQYADAFDAFERGK